MPMDWTLHEDSNPLASRSDEPPAPRLPHIGGQKSLAEGVDSSLITVTSPCVVQIVATAKVRFDCQKVDPGNEVNTIPPLDPVNSPIVLLADQPRIYALAPGKYRLKAAAYAL